MKRRDFITLLGGAATWPVAARGQKREMRRIAVLYQMAADDPDATSRVTTFAQVLQALGWIDGGNVRIDYRWGNGDADRVRIYAAELIALAPDVLLTGDGQTARALQRATRTVPIVFAGSLDPVGGGLVASLARPGGNMTGFAGQEYSVAGKLLELLKQIAPRITRVAVIRTTNQGGIGQYGAIQLAAPALGVEVTPVNAIDPGDIERNLGTF